MNFLNRAYKNVTRRFTKSILLAVTFFLIGNLVILGLGVSQAAENAKLLTRQKMRAVVTYEIDYQEYYNYINTLTDQDEINDAYNNYPRLNKDIAFEISKDEDVKTFNYMTTNVVYSQNFTNVPLGNEEMNNMYNTYTDELGNVIEYQSPNIYIFTNIIPNMIEFEEGTNQIVEGRFYNQQEIDSYANVVLVSKELAEVNNLRVGDSITLSTQDLSSIDSNYENFGITKEFLTNEFEIVGIYNTNNDIDPNSQNFKYAQPYESPKNYIYMPLTTLGSIQYEQSIKMEEYYNSMYPSYGDTSVEPQTIDNYLIPHTVVLLIDDPLNVDDFVARNANRLEQYTRLNANNETFKSISKPLDTLSFFANVIVWIVGINAIVIITLVTALTLKTRESEIGVLLSLGVSKVKIVAQLFVELLIVALLGFTLAIGSGSLIAGSVGDKVLQFQQSQEESDDDDYFSYSYNDPTDYFSEVSQEDLFSEYRVSVNPILIAEIYIFGLGVVFIAILIPSVMIMRLSPKQILLSTN